MASKFRKTILGGQGGDEIFGGYARYMVAYIEQAFLGELEGTSENGNYVLTLSKSLKNLDSLKSYKPLIKSFWSNGLFEKPDSRYLQLIRRSVDIKKYLRPIKKDIDYDPITSYYDLFNSNNFHKESYFDKMTHFDFKTLLPALLHVEDRMSMANGIESRVPFLDHKIIELAATIPANIKFKDGKLKEILRISLGKILPKEVLERKDKMGFPIPLTQWIKNDLRDYIISIFDSKESRDRNFFENDKIIESIGVQKEFSREFWALLSLELWFREFHDKEEYYKQLI
jgi:asparagine synthase (glutamine-hydrolysing)